MYGPYRFMGGGSIMSDQRISLGAFINPHTVVKKLHPNPVLRVRTDPGDYLELNVILPLPQEYKSRWKPKGCDVIVLSLCEDYAKGLLSARDPCTVVSYMLIR